MTIQKNMILQYNNPRSVLDLVQYKVIRSGKKYVTLEAVSKVGVNPQLVGLPTFRQPYNIALNDLKDAINQDIYRVLSDIN